MYPPATLAERLGIVGGGAIARGIARVACEHGDVVMWVRSPHKVEAPEEVEVTSDLDALEGSEVVVEAIAEDLEAKADLYQRLPKLDGALLCTTTSSLS